LRELSANFNSAQRVEERLYAFATERHCELKDYLDPINKDTVGNKLDMQMNCVRHVMNVELADNAQTEFFRQECVEECPDFMLKYAPLSAAMLMTTAVKYLQAKDKSTQPLSYNARAPVRRANDRAGRGAVDANLRQLPDEHRAGVQLVRRRRLVAREHDRRQRHPEARGRGA
jgi:hypothetical protein